MPSTHSMRITTYWLLGLIEGEGSFLFSRSNQILKSNFSLSLTASQEPLIREISCFHINFLRTNNLICQAGSYTNFQKLVGVYGRDSREGNAKERIPLLLF